jgi:hypothetical protein
VHELHATRRRKEQVQRLEPLEPPAGLAGEEVAEQLAAHEVGDEKGDRRAADRDRLLRAVLHQDGAVAQLVQFLRVDRRDAAQRIDVRVEKLRRALDAGGALTQGIDLALADAAERGNDLVFFGQNTTGLEIIGERHGNSGFPNGFNETFSFGSQRQG